VLERVTGFEPV